MLNSHQVSDLIYVSHATKFNLDDIITILKKQSNNDWKPVVKRIESNLNELNNFIASLEIIFTLKKLPAFNNKYWNN